MRAVLTVVGKDRVGIFYRVSEICAKNNVNIADVSQSIMQDMFCMIMLVDMSKCELPLVEFQDIMRDLGRDLGLSIRVMHEDIFNSMHRI